MSEVTKWMKKIKIGEIVNTFNPKDPKPCNSPMDPGNLKLEDYDNLLSNNSNYRQTVGTLQYIVTIARPIYLHMWIFSQRNEKPRVKD